MKTTISKRIEMLRTHLGLTQLEFSNLVGITSTQLSRLENGKNEPGKATINQILNKIDVNKDWFVEGKGELTAQVKASNVNAGNNPYKDALVSELKSQVEYLKRMLELAMSGKAPNFLKALGLTAVPYLLPGKNEGTVSRGRS